MSAAPLGLDRRQFAGRRGHCLGRIGEILEPTTEILFVGLQVEVPVAAQVEEDDALLPSFARRQRLIDGVADGVSGLGGGDDPLGACDSRTEIRRPASMGRGKPLDSAADTGFVMRA